MDEAAGFLALVRICWVELQLVCSGSFNDGIQVFLANGPHLSWLERGAVYSEVDFISSGEGFNTCMSMNMCWFVSNLEDMYGDHLQDGVHTAIGGKKDGKHSSVASFHMTEMSVELGIVFKSSMKANVWRDGMQLRHCMVDFLLSLLEAPVT